MSNQFVQVYHGVGNEMYKTSCSQCGGDVFTWVKRKNVNFLCKVCRENKKQQDRERKNPLRELQAERRLEIAVEYLENKRIIEGYSKSLDVIGKNIYRPGWFQSSNEILVALELLRNGIKARHQVKFGRWKVDFVIPELKVVLEVDGVLYHRAERKEKDKIRDAAIIAHLGPEWEVVRIDETMIRKNLKKLLPAIKRVVRERKKVRTSNSSQLPRWYSDNQI